MKVKIVKDLLKQQKLAVLATEKEGQPYTNLIAFAHSEDLKNILFATPRCTRKYTNIEKRPGVSILIDNRSNTALDFTDAVVVNAMGEVKEVEKTEELLQLYLAKQPHLKSFLSATSSALMQMEVKKYIIATRFQNVEELDMS